MGASTSKHQQEQPPIERYSAEEIASHVASFGDKYKDYASQIRERSMDGAFFASLNEGEFQMALDSMDISLRLHRRKLERVFQRSISDGSDMDSSNCSDFSKSSDSTPNSTSTGATSPFASNVADESRSFLEEEHRRRSRRHIKTQSDINVELFMNVALEAKKLDASARTPPTSSTDRRPGEYTNAVLESALAAQAMETMALQKDILELNHSRAFDKHSPLPEGTVTIVLTDIEGSTNMWEANPKAMRRALITHDDIQRKLRTKHFGYEIDTAGDAFFLAFAEPGDALAFALELQTSLNEAEWEDEMLDQPWACDDGARRGLRVRVAIHAGPAGTTKNTVTGRTEYEGEAIAIAQKVEAMARGGQVLVTSDTWNAAFHLADVTLGSPNVKEMKEKVLVEQDDDEDTGITAKRVFDITPLVLPPLNEPNTAKGTSSPKQKITTFPHEAVALATIANNEQQAAPSLLKLTTKEKNDSGPLTPSRKCAQKPAGLRVNTESSPVRV